MQLGSPAKVYMIGGGEFNMNARSLREIRQLEIKQSLATFKPLADMRHQRHGHSACAAGDKFIVVTGSRNDKVGSTCEIYDVEQNKWSDLPAMRMPRHYHSSCCFNSSLIFVFCGIQNQTKKYMSSIEVLDLTLFHKNVVSAWQPFEVKQEPGAAGAVLTARQGLGTCQVDAEGILILGGYTGAFN